MKANELRQLSEEELKQKKKELAQEVFNLKFQQATSQLENTARIPQSKRELARVETILREKRENKGSKHGQK